MGKARQQERKSPAHITPTVESKEDEGCTVSCQLSPASPLLHSSKTPALRTVLPTVGWDFFSQLKQDSTHTPTPTSQPTVDACSLRLFSQVIVGYVKLTVKVNHYSYTQQFSNSIFFFFFFTFHYLLMDFYQHFSDICLCLVSVMQGFLFYLVGYEPLLLFILILKLSQIRISFVQILYFLSQPRNQPFLQGALVTLRNDIGSPRPEFQIYQWPLKYCGSGLFQMVVRRHMCFLHAPPWIYLSICESVGVRSGSQRSLQAQPSPAQPH